jgi:hypothetical protein
MMVSYRVYNVSKKPLVSQKTITHTHIYILTSCPHNPINGAIGHHHHHHLARLRPRVLPSLRGVGALYPDVP